MSDPVKGFKPLLRRMKGLQGKTQQKILRKGIAKMSLVVRKEMRRRAPAKKTGTLHKNLKWSIRKHPRGGFTSKVGAFNEAFYAKFIEGGAKSHEIPSKTVGRGSNKRANKKRVMIDGWAVFSRVKHPGVRSKPFIEPSLQASKNKALEEAGKLMFKEIVKAFK